MHYSRKINQRNNKYIQANGRGNEERAASYHSGRKKSLYKKGSIQEHFMKLWRKLHQYARKWGWGRRNTPVKAIALGRDTASIDSILCKSDTKSEGILEKASLVKYVKAFMYCKNRRRHQHKSCRMQMQPEQIVTCKIEGKHNSSCLHHWC